MNSFKGGHNSKKIELILFQQPARVKIMKDDKGKYSMISREWITIEKWRKWLLKSQMKAFNKIMMENAEIIACIL